MLHQVVPHAAVALQMFISPLVYLWNNILLSCLIKGESERRKVYHFQYLDWSEDELPVADHVFSMIENVKNRKESIDAARSAPDSSPVVVHCRWHPMPNNYSVPPVAINYSFIQLAWKYDENPIPEIV